LNACWIILATAEYLSARDLG